MLSLLWAKPYASIIKHNSSLKIAPPPIYAVLQLQKVDWWLHKWLKEISMEKEVGERYQSGDIKNYKSGRIYYKRGDFI